MNFYEDIKYIIDEIVGIDTQQGNNLKIAIKKYFELKQTIVKLNSSKSPEKNITVYPNANLTRFDEIIAGADKALLKLGEKLRRTNGRKTTRSKKKANNKRNG